MTPCPCCRWTLNVPAELPAGVAACPNCGQCLRLPPPWADAAIPSCDTRLLVAARGSLQPPDTFLLRPDVTCQIRPSGKRGPGPRLGLGVMGILLGLFLAVGLIATRGGGLPNSPPQQVFALAATALILLAGGALTWMKLRKARQHRPARVLPASCTLPPEAFQLGTPLSLHYADALGRWVQVAAGLLLFCAGTACLTVVLSGEGNALRHLRVAVLGIPVGLFMLWKGANARTLWVLACQQGMVVFRDGRSDVWRWDEIDAVWLKVVLRGTSAVAYATTLRRRDGETFTLTPDIEFLENQLSVRVQYELCKRLLPGLTETLRSGGALDFGPLQLVADGLRRGSQVMSWEEIATSHVQGEELTIQKRGGGWGSRWTMPVDRVANVAVLLHLLQGGAVASTLA